MHWRRRHEHARIAPLQDRRQAQWSREPRNEMTAMNDIQVSGIWGANFWRDDEVFVWEPG